MECNSQKWNREKAAGKLQENISFLLEREMEKTKKHETFRNTDWVFDDTRELFILDGGITVSRLWFWREKKGPYLLEYLRIKWNGVYDLLQNMDGGDLKNR